MINIEDDIKILKDKDCLWIYSEDDILKAQEHILAEREQDKARIKALELQNKQLEHYIEELKKYNKTVSDRIIEYKKNSIPKQKVKDVLNDIYDYFERLNGPDEDIEYIESKRKELLEEGE